VIDDREHTPDELDRASNLTQAATDYAIAEQRRKARPEQEQSADGTWPVTQCVDCECDIPMARLQMGKIRCVDCQGFLEKSRGR